MHPLCISLWVKDEHIDRDNAFRRKNNFDGYAGENVTLFLTGNNVK